MTIVNMFQKVHNKCQNLLCILWYSDRMNELKDYYMLKSLFHIRIDMRIYVGSVEVDTTIPKKQPQYAQETIVHDLNKIIGDLSSNSYKEVFSSFFFSSFFSIFRRCQSSVFRRMNVCDAEYWTTCVSWIQITMIQTMIVYMSLQKALHN